jgi:hypothetical protein
MLNDDSAKPWIIRSGDAGTFWHDCFSLPRRYTALDGQQQQIIEGRHTKVMCAKKWPTPFRVSRFLKIAEKA